MHRRSVLTLVGTSAAAWPLAARGQEAAMPVVGFLAGRADDPHAVAAFHRGLGETGFVEGPQCGDRIPQGGWPVRSITGNSRRSCSPPSDGDCRGGR
jgi:hypothetical protein